MAHEKKDLAEIQKLIGYRFRRRHLLVEALTHPSYAFENSTPSYQRFEFLGDAVLSLVVAERIFAVYPGADEGELTQRRADIVQGTTLAEISREMGLGKYLLLGRGEEKQGGRRTPSNLANALEALIGAMYVDRDIRYCRKFIDRHILRSRL